MGRNVKQVERDDGKGLKKQKGALPPAFQVRKEQKNYPGRPLKIKRSAQKHSLEGRNKDLRQSVSSEICTSTLIKKKITFPYVLRNSEESGAKSYSI